MSTELTRLTHTLARHVGYFLERQGWLEPDVEISYPTCYYACLIPFPTHGF